MARDHSLPDVHVREAIHFRLHKHDKILFQKMLKEESLSFQKFADACMQAFLRGDRAIHEIIKDWKALNEIPPEEKDRYSMSVRERKALEQEIALVTPLKDEP